MGGGRTDASGGGGRERASSGGGSEEKRHGERRLGEKEGSTR